MTLRDATSVDIVIELPGDERRVGLVVVDDGHWSTPEERMEALRKKMAFYVFFVQTGHFARSNPELADAQLSIEVVCRRPPTAEMRRVQQIVHKGPPWVDMDVHVSDWNEFFDRLERLAAQE